jgi:hypothetical protein
MTTAVEEEGAGEEQDEWDLALVARAEHALFSSHDIVLNNEDSISVFQNRYLLKDVKVGEKKVVFGGLQRGATGVRVTEEGIFRDVGKVYCSISASANMLSFASQIDIGADISYCIRQA